MNQNIPTIPTISAREFDILAHALGTRGNKPSYRNHFCTNEDTTDYSLCEKLVAKGLMIRSKKSWCPDIIYTVTALGRTFVIPHSLN